MKRVYLISSSFLEDSIKNIFSTVLVASIIIFSYWVLSIGELFFQKEIIVKECKWEDSIICYFPIPRGEIEYRDYIEKVNAINSVESCTFLPMEYDFVNYSDDLEQNLFLVNDLGNIADRYPLNIVEGRYPERNTNEIVVNESVSEIYRIGDNLSLTNPITQKYINLTIVGYVSDATILTSNGSKSGEIAAYARDEVNRGIYLDGIFSSSPAEISSSYYLSENSVNIICLGYDISMDGGDYVKDQYVNPYFLIVNCKKNSDIDATILELEELLDPDTTITSFNTLLSEYRADNNVAIERFSLYLIALLFVYIIVIGVNLYNKILKKTEELYSYYIGGCGYYRSVMLSLSGYFVSVVLGVMISCGILSRKLDWGKYLAIVLGILLLNLLITIISVYWFKQQNEKTKTNM